jgi:hypothetical protein
LIFFNDASPPAPTATFSAGGIEFESADAAIQFNNANYTQLRAELRSTELRLGQSRFLCVDPPSLSDALYEDLVNMIVAISNIDSIEINRNNSSNTHLPRPFR